MPSRSKVEYIEQKFVLSSQTTFQQLLAECSMFWSLDPEEFSLFGSKFENIMCLNQQKDHPAHYVTSYFELLRIRYPLLYLLRPENSQP